MTHSSLDVADRDAVLRVANTELRVSWAVGSHAGLVRSDNQDSYAVDRGAFVVCDGMGGYEGGGRASAVASRVVAASWDHGCPTVSDVFDSVLHANDAVNGQVERQPELAGMGTTAAGVVAADNGGSATLVVLNIGDSRVYLARAGSVSQISHDHSVIQELLDSGDITPSDVAGHPERHVITRAIGGMTAQPDVWLLAPEDGQRFLISSDGVHADVADGDLTAALQQGRSPAAVVTRLLELSLEAGGRDNATAIVVDVVRCVPVSEVQDETVPRLRGSQGSAS